MISRPTTLAIGIRHRGAKSGGGGPNARRAHASPDRQRRRGPRTPASLGRRGRARVQRHTTSAHLLDEEGSREAIEQWRSRLRRLRHGEGHPDPASAREGALARESRAAGPARRGITRRYASSVPDALALIANVAGKLTREGLRATGRGATALPGLVALTLDPDFIGALSATLAHGVAGVSGTNGKTTTARMLADISRTAGWDPIHNRSGSNLDRGVAAALLAQSSWSAEPRGNFGLFEIDEASLPSAVGRLRPRVVVVTNLFRDQMDRYFELDTLARKIGDALAGLPGDTTLVLNADDPLVAYLALPGPRSGRGDPRARELPPGFRTARNDRAQGPDPAPCPREESRWVQCRDRGAARDRAIASSPRRPERPRRRRARRLLDLGRRLRGPRPVGGARRHHRAARAGSRPPLQVRRAREGVSRGRGRLGRGDRPSHHPRARGRRGRRPRDIHGDAGVARGARPGRRDRAVLGRLTVMDLRIAHLYPDLMNIYGDRGNVIALTQRAKWRGMGVEVRPYSVGEWADPLWPDVWFFGGGQGQGQAIG